MPKECKKCGEPMPDEANLCLSCFTVYGEADITDDNDKGIGAFALIKSKLFETSKNLPCSSQVRTLLAPTDANKKRFALVAAALLCVLLIAGSALYLNSDAIRFADKITNDKTVVSSTTDDDGSVKTEYDDGSVETKKPDGTVITEETDGTVITEGADGTVVTETPDETVITKKPDGTVITEEADGTVITENTDNTVITEKPDGTVITEEADGTVSTKKPDGTVTTEKRPVETTTAPSTTKPSGIFGSLFEKPTAAESTSNTTTKPASSTAGATAQRPSTTMTKPTGATNPASTGTTEATTKKPANTTTTTTTTKPASTSTTEVSTQKPTTTEKETTTKKQEAPPTNYNDFTFEYKEGSDGVKRLYITKYTGHDEVVNVPYSYNGEYVHEVYTNAIVRNSSVKKIIFNATEDHAPYIRMFAVYQCDNLEEIVYNWSNYSSPYSGTKTIADSVVGGCPNLKSIKVTGSDYYTVYENGLYYNKDTAAYPNDYVISQAWGPVWHQPSWCNKVDQFVFQGTMELKEIYINPTHYTFSKLLSGYLEKVHIDKSNPEYFDDNGVVYNKLTKECSFYPSKRRDESYTFLDGYTIKNEHSLYATYSYIKIIYIPKNFRFNTEYGQRFLWYSNLDAVYVEKGNPDIDFIKQYYKGNIIIY